MGSWTLIEKNSSSPQCFSTPVVVLKLSLLAGPGLDLEHLSSYPWHPWHPGVTWARWTWQAGASLMRLILDPDSFWITHGTWILLKSYVQSPYNITNCQQFMVCNTEFTVIEFIWTYLFISWNPGIMCLIVASSRCNWWTPSLFDYWLAIVRFAEVHTAS